MTPAARRAAWCVLAAVLACVGLAHAQRDGSPFDPARPLLLRVPVEPSAAARNAQPLDPVQMQIVREALMLRQSGRIAEARQRLVALGTASQRHPIVLTERARLDLAEHKYAEVVRVASYERRVLRDSLLLGEELVEAYERMGRAREASATAVEVWVAAAAEENWALDLLVRFAPTDGRAGRDGLRRGWTRDPSRTDLARGLARLEWLAGDLRAGLKVLATLERAERGPRQRWGFGEMLLLLATSRDSVGALDVFLDVAADPTQDGAYRQSAARRFWQLASVRGIEATQAPRLWQAMKDVPSERWGDDLALAVARALRRSGDTAAARTLLSAPAAGTSAPAVALERMLADLRDGPPERVLEALAPGADADEERRFWYAEALFFAGHADSALASFKRLAGDPQARHTGAALERIFLLEDGKPATALPAFGRIAYEQWRGANPRARALAESLWVALPKSPLWAQAALLVSAERERAGDARGALTAVLAVADSLSDDRLAPVARQRAGDLYSARLHDDARAIEQYEACVARYPRAWNAPEVRRRLEELRRTRRF